MSCIFQLCCKKSNNYNDKSNIDSDANWSNTVPFVPPVESGKVIKVYDGDTITIASKLPFKSSPLYRFSVRLNGIDCPEIKGSNETEKEIAKIAKTRLSDLILNKTVTLTNVKTEKYGRILADVTYNGVVLNQYMIHERLAVKYDGGTKITPTCWKTYYESGIHESHYAPNKRNQTL